MNTKMWNRWILAMQAFVLACWLVATPAMAEGVSVELGGDQVEVLDETDLAEEVALEDELVVADNATEVSEDDLSVSDEDGRRDIEGDIAIGEEPVDGDIELQAMGGAHSKETKTNLSLGKQYSRSIIGHQYDQYNFSLSSAANLTIRLTTKMSSIYIWLYESSSHAMWFVNFNNKSGTHTKGNASRTVNVPKGNYTVLVEEISNKSGSYSVRVDKNGAAKMSAATISSISEQAYTGKALKPTPTVKLNVDSPFTLRAGTDYTVSYKNNTKIGTASVIVTGKGGFTGTKTVNFKIISKGTFFRDASPIDANNHGKEVDWMGTAGISTGWTVTGGREFRGLQAVTRCDFAAFLYRLGDIADNGKRDDSIKLSDSKVKTVLATVSDCDTKTPHAAEVAWLVNSGISRGWSNSDGSTVSFRPTAKVARQDMAAFLYRFADVQDNGSQDKSLAQGSVSVKFTDVINNDEANHAYEVRWLASVGITKGWALGSKFEFRGTRTVARQDMAAFMYRLNSYLG